MKSICVKSDTMSAEDIYKHFTYCKTPIVGVDLMEHSQKLRQHATTVEAWSGEQLLGMCACYMNDNVNKIAYISHIEVHPECKGKGIGKSILTATEQCAKNKGMESIRLEVALQNTTAYNFYLHCGYEVMQEHGTKFLMQRVLTTNK